MFGWEFPPFKSGGLGTACYDLTKGMANLGYEVTFVMPFAPDKSDADFVKLRGAAREMAKIKIRKVDSILSPYQTLQSYEETYNGIVKPGSSGSIEIYGKNMHEEVKRFALLAKKIAKEEKFDIIHAHDWMTYEAGINARAATGKPLVVHIHATEFDRTRGSPNPMIRDMEFRGLNEADSVIANSNFTKNNVIRDHGIDPDKIEVVHWGIDPDNPHYQINYRSALSRKDKIILFLGRMTVQKGPEYFVETAKKVSEHVKNVKFVMAGSGDMMPHIMHMVAELGISDKVIFTGFLTGADVHKAFQMADLYVMPSTSEPFGLVALESLKNNTPMIISKQSGVSEVVQNALKVDFWDVDEMTNKIVSILRHPELYSELKENSFQEVQKFNLEEPAQKCIDCYKKVLERWKR
jgi:glycosyltransferase involved in cell wall biosynthesis